MFLKQLVLLVVVAMACGIVAHAQTPGLDSSVTSMNIYWIKASDDVSPTNQATLYFCNWVGGTFGGPDSAALNVKEFEGPPASPGFDVRFTSPSTNVGRTAAYGTAHYLWDIREIAPLSNLKQVDTFAIKFIDNGDATANFKFQWDHTWLAARADSCFLRYTDGTQDPAVTVKVDMFANDSVMITSDLFAAGATKITIFKFGDRPLKVKEIKNTVPAGFALHQNYPNPFNPSTTIQFDVQKAGFVEVAVFNLLGQRVSTLVSGQMNPGTFSTMWNGLDAQNRPATSGVYFARMIARGNDGIEQFSALRKLLLMK